MTAPDLSEFYEEVHPGPLCSVCALLLGGSLGEERTAKLRAALASPSIHGTKIAGVLRSWDVKIGSQAVQRHRNGRDGYHPER